MIYIAATHFLFSADIFKTQIYRSPGATVPPALVMAATQTS